MLNKFKQAAVFSLGTLISTTAFAEINANLGATTEYVREGISQTRGKPTLQAGLTWQHNSGFYLGGWASGMDHRNDDDLNLEADYFAGVRSEEHTSELQSRPHLVCRLLLEKKKQQDNTSN